MTVSIDVPQELADRLQQHWKDLPRRALEAVVVEAYRDEVLSAAEVGQVLGHASRWETERFLDERQAALGYTPDDLAHDDETLRRLGPP